ncbi:hypothetical protein L6252_02740 [Candidatus Parcubacteria bacterium]|nr:hypothetical protein [Candidatus Parcubacteria bacterium]
MLKKNRQEQVKVLKQALKKGNLKRQEYVRAQAVYLNLVGYTHKEISQITLKSIDALEEWITLFNKQGIEGLKDKPITKERHCVLTKEQKDKVKAVITKNSPAQAGLKGDFWSPLLLKQLVQKEFGLAFKTKKAYIDLLRYCGFTYQKVQYKDSRENNKYKDHEKLRLEKKLKNGVLRMYW